MAIDLLATLKLKDDFTSPLSKATSAMRGAERSSNSLSSSIGGIGTAALGFAGAIGLTSALSSAFNTLKSSVSSAFERIDTMESFDRTMTTLTGSAEKAKDALEATRDAVTGTAYGLDIAAKGVQDFVTRGMDIGKATEVVSAWGDAVAFYGNGSNEQLASVSDALAKMYSSGKVGMDQMNRLYNVGIDGVGMYAKAVGRDAASVQKDLSGGAISAENFVEVVTDAMMNGTNGVHKIAGAAKEAGDSWGAVFDNMRAAVTRGVVGIIEKIDEMLTTNGLPTMREIIKNFGSQAEKALNNAAKAIEPLASALTRLYDFIKPAIPMFKGAAIAVGIFLTAVGGISLAMSTISLIASPISLIVLAVAGLGAAFVAAYNHIEPFRNVVDGVFDSVKMLFSILKGEIPDTSDWNLDDFHKFFDIKDRVEAFKGLISTVKDGVMEFVQSVAERFSGLVEKFNGYKERLSEMWASLKDIFLTGADAVGNVISALAGVLGPVLSIIISALGVLGDIAMWAFEFVIIPLAGLVMSIFSAMWTILGPILELFGAALGVVGEVALWLWDNAIKPLAEYLGGEFKGFIETATKIVDKIGGAFEGVSGKVETLVGWVKDFAGLIKNIKVPDWITSAAGGVVNFVTGGGKGHFHGLDDVPYDGYSATLHRGERVLTAQENREYSGKTGGGSPSSNSVVISGNEFHVRKETDIKDIAYELAKLIEREGAQMA